MGAASRPKERDYRLPFKKAIAIYNHKTGRYEAVNLAKKMAKPAKLAPAKTARSTAVSRPKVQKRTKASMFFDIFPLLKQPTTTKGTQKTKKEACRQ
ncbi:uncharacterized protein GIQ15_02093 [Arthroderma uncinatum]|uniref:uncharacterized protein n=1 Tax=Arthroderma uncinatum TaxID=74035 RepID=UPI00144ABB86|nr:uncharacterized protein GIQ15_02093 [Arthroderma uncinatum]KAF3482769.1 hypothetical protein GIQ15_02093 [Arthroderma uncinatum]